MASIAAELRIARATVSRVLARAGLSRLAALDPAPLPRRYERARPGELLHIDSKKLAFIERTGHRITGDRHDHVRGAGWEAAFVAIDDRSRVGFVEMFADERKRSAAAFLDHAARYYRDLGVRVRCIMTDNAKVFRSLPFTAVCRRWRLRHIFTKRYTPRTNGKAERFIQTALREWAYGRTYRHSRERTAYLPEWLHRYNWHRPHSALAGHPPISRLSIDGDNLVRLHT
jgi:transposase InsO family protein